MSLDKDTIKLALRENEADALRLAGRDDLADKIIPPRYSADDMREELGLTRSQWTERVNANVIPSPVDVGEDRELLWDADALNRMLDVKANGTLFTTGATQAEDDELAAIRATGEHSAEAIANKLNLPISKTREAIEYAHFSPVDHRNGKDLYTDEALDHLEKANERGELFGRWS